MLRKGRRYRKVGGQASWGQGRDLRRRRPSDSRIAGAGWIYARPGRRGGRAAVGCRGEHCWEAEPGRFRKRGYERDERVRVRAESAQSRVLSRWLIEWEWSRGRERRRGH